MPLLHLLVGTLFALAGAGLQAPPSDAASTPAHAVLYLEVMTSARPQALTALKQYRDTSRKEEGVVRLDLFEQTGRPGHFAIVETWRDQKAFEAHAAASQKALFDTLRPVRLSEYDQRPYKNLSVGTAKQAAGNGAVSVVSHVDVAPNPRVAVLLTQLAEASRQDEGNIRFDVLQHTMRANHFTVIETWQSQKALDAHVAAAHTKAYRDELQPLTGSPLDERVYKTVE